MVKHYWAFICRRAFKEACATVYLYTRERVVIAAVVVLSGILALVFWGSSDASRDEMVMRFGIIAATLVLLFFIFAWKVVSVPAAVDAERVGQITTLKERLTPRVSLSLPSDAAKMLREGITHVAMAGNRQSIIKRQPVLLRVTCTNESDVRVDECQAFLVDVRAIEADGRDMDVGFRESVALLWSRDLERPEFETSIQPRTSKAIYLLRFTESKDLVLHRSLEIPFEYHQLFKQDVRYRLWVQVNGKDDVATGIVIDVVRDRSGETLNATVVVAERIDPLRSGIIQSQGGAANRG